MKWLLLLLASAAFAQQSGEALFAKTCGTGYCHATKGVGGGAPRLAARGFTAEFIRDTVTKGVAGTGMAAYGGSMPKRELDAVVNYVGSLNGIVGGGAQPVRRAFAGVAERGRVLFSEATRGFGRCSTCHQANGVGISVAPPLRQVPLNAAALKALATPAVATARMGAEAMPALVVAKRSTEVLFYDLTSAPPVLRTLAPGEVQFADGSAWRHASVLGTYSDAELNAILAFLR